MFSYNFALHEWETVEEAVVDGIYKCGYWGAEHALLHVLELVLFVGNGV